KPMLEARMREIIRDQFATSMNEFMANLNNGAGGSGGARQLIQDKADEATEGEKRKGKGDRGSRGDNRREHNRRQNQRRGNVWAMTNVAPNNNETCQKCKNKRHAGDYWKCIKC
nr:hypothetical protein [Tanacetum cinerariifolium]